MQGEDNMHKNNTENEQMPNDVWCCVCSRSTILFLSLARTCCLSLSIFRARSVPFARSHYRILSVSFHYYSMCIEHTACMALTHVFAFVVCCIVLCCAVLCCVMCVFSSSFLSFVASVFSRTGGELFATA